MGNSGTVGQLDLITILIVLISLLISITIHEAMHAFTSHWLGDDTAEREGRITLNPFKHIDIFSTILLPIITLLIFKVPLLAAKPVPFNPNRVKFEEFGAALVGLAGPLTNLVLALFTSGIIRLLGDSMSPGVLDVLGIFLIINIGLFVFNMIPIPPLDGSRLLYAVAPRSVQSFMASLENFGIIIIFFLIITIPGFGIFIAELNSRIVDFLV